MRSKFKYKPPYSADECFPRRNLAFRCVGVPPLARRKGCGKHNVKLLKQFYKMADKGEIPANVLRELIKDD